MSSDPQLDGERTGNWEPRHPVYFPRDHWFYIATRDASAWRVPTDGDADGFVIDGVLIETLFRKAKVPDPTSMVHPLPRGGERKVFENTLHLDWLVEGMRHLEEYGVFQDEDGGDDVRVFETLD